uniref:Carbonic anhydrase n=1 Tax=Psilocybe cubensis TaxID=181762 RepID=A0A8H7XUL0_PSICU
MRASSLVFVVFWAVASVLAHPVNQQRDIKIIGRTESVKVVAETSNRLQMLSIGNQAFRDKLSKESPTLLKTLADEGQAPPFMFLGCSDSRVSEGTIFSAQPGTLFTQRNIANQYHKTDPNAQSVLSYAVSELGVSHVIVMGHYGCGGVAASIASAPTAEIDAASGSIQSWISPIRNIYETSTRAEIVEHRVKHANASLVEEPEIQDPAFRALVEENVKASVNSIVKDSVISNHFAALSAAKNVTGNARRSGGGPAKDVFVHGFVYDIETGIVHDLGVSVGPPGVPIPTVPFSAVAKAATEASKAHDSGSSSHSTEAPKKRSRFWRRTSA